MTPLLLGISWLIWVLYKQTLGLLPLNHMDLKSTQFYDYALMIIAPAFYISCFVMSFRRTDLTVYDLDECRSTCAFINNLFINLGFFLYVTIQGFTLFRRKTFYVVFERRLKLIDDQIHHCQRRIDYQPKEEKLYLKFFKKSHWAFLCLGFGYSIFHDARHTYDIFGSYFIIPFVTTTFPYLCASLVQLQFICFVCRLLSRFRLVNALFEAINVDSTDKERVETIKIFDIVSQMARKPTKSNSSSKLIISDEDLTVYNLDENKYLPEEEIIQQDTSHNLQKETYLPELFELHDRVLSLSEITNSAYGPQSVPYMVVCFVITIMTIFVQTKVIIVLNQNNEYLSYSAILMAVWSMLTMAVAYLILNFCFNTNNCSKKSAMVVHDIIQKKPVFMLGDDFYYNKMKSFSLQYLHWENYFQFNGIGLFRLDYTFIFSAISAGTSYLIVLLQFDMTNILQQDGLI